MRSVLEVVGWIFVVVGIGGGVILLAMDVYPWEITIELAITSVLGGVAFLGFARIIEVLEGIQDELRAQNIAAARRHGSASASPSRPAPAKHYVRNGDRMEEVG